MKRTLIVCWLVLGVALIAACAVMPDKRDESRTLRIEHKTYSIKHIIVKNPWTSPLVELRFRAPGDGYVTIQRHGTGTAKYLGEMSGKDVKDLNLWSVQYATGVTFELQGETLIVDQVVEPMIVLGSNPVKKLNVEVDIPGVTHEVQKTGYGYIRYRFNNDVGMAVFTLPLYHIQKEHLTHLEGLIFRNTKRRVMITMEQGVLTLTDTEGKCSDFLQQQREWVPKMEAGWKKVQADEKNKQDFDFHLGQAKRLASAVCLNDFSLSLAGCNFEPVAVPALLEEGAQHWKLRASKRKLDRIPDEEVKDLFRLILSRVIIRINDKMESASVEPVASAKVTFGKPAQWETITAGKVKASHGFGKKEIFKIKVYKSKSEGYGLQFLRYLDHPWIMGSAVGEDPPPRETELIWKVYLGPVTFYGTQVEDEVMQKFFDLLKKAVKVRGIFPEMIMSE
ncbi:MAG: hypothetical protein ABIC04_02225 [Nanoarchaeota archaeon]